MLRVEIIADPLRSAAGGPSLRSQIDEAMQALGFNREVGGMPAIAEPARPVTGNVRSTAEEDAKAFTDAGLDPATGEKAPATAEATEDKPRRRRRTNAEIEAAKAGETTGQAISTNPEHRVDPETEKQDAADEKAETKGADLTIDDIRNALGVYVEKFGMEAVQVDGKKLLELILKDKAPAKISELPTDQATLRAVLDGFEEMTAKNPFKRELVKPKG